VDHDTINSLKCGTVVNRLLLEHLLQLGHNFGRLREVARSVLCKTVSTQTLNFGAVMVAHLIFTKLFPRRNSDITSWKERYSHSVNFVRNSSTDRARESV